MNGYQKLACAILTGVLAGPAYVAITTAQNGSYEGSIVVRGAVVSIGDKEFKITSRTECRDQQNIKTTCETLAQIGYAAQARITVSGETVTQIAVIDSAGNTTTNKKP